MKAVLNYDEAKDPYQFYFEVTDDAGEQRACTPLMCLADLKFVDEGKKQLGLVISQLAVDLNMDICDTLTLLMPALEELQRLVK